MVFFSCRVVAVKHVKHEIHVDVLRAVRGLLLLFLSDKEDFAHLDEFGLLPQATIHLRILCGGHEWIFDGVLDANEGLFLHQVVLGVFVPTQVLNGIRDEYSSLLVSTIFEFDYACFELILGELPAEAAHCIIARIIDLPIHRLHVLSPQIVLLRTPNILDQPILCSISAQLRHVSEPSVRLTFFLEEGLVDTLAERLKEVGEFLDLVIVPLLMTFIKMLAEVKGWELLH